MSVDAAAELLRRGDPDRLSAALCAQAGDRARLVSLYAANLEIARAALASREPLISLMRLQWWADRLGDLAAGRDVAGQHAVLDALAENWGKDAGAIASLAEARRRDAMREPFTEDEALLDYIDASAGNLMRLAARGCGLEHHPAITDQARGAGLAAWLDALPALGPLGLGLSPAEPARIAALARAGLGALDRARGASGVPRRAAPALFAGPGARARLLAHERSEIIEMSEFSKRLAFLNLGFLGRWKS
ncbi:MAG: squalene/phytoene synthase family protein [Paracoccus sp. (in: a-proteobacteria)]|nr:squalene/phytoene synthase family protein [Paracoccus sp. (in: a-proteobacteria)]